MELGNVERIDLLIDKLEIFDRKLDDYGQLLMDSPEVDELFSKLNAEQMSAGVNSDYTQISPEYAAATVRIKQKKGQPTNRVTLEDTGGFHGGIRARTFAGKIELLSEDSKSADLQGKYGDKIFGLTAGNLFIVRDFLKPKFMYFTRKVLL